MSHPYEQLGPKAFWRSAVAGPKSCDLSQIFAPKFGLTARDPIATAGSCFAQHIGPALRAAGCCVVDAEPAPSLLPPDQAARFGFGIYAARFGNIYTPRQLRHLLAEALAPSPPPPLIWTRGARFFDALRPTIEPDGFDSPQEIALHRAAHLAALRRGLATTSLFILTLGLTEAWQDIGSGRVLPICPGVIAGVYDPAATRFLHLRYSDILADLAAIRSDLQRLNPKMRLLLTLSPVPLRATASGEHVLCANAASKASLRAAAGDFAADHADVDYFPAYELITTPRDISANFLPNLRQVQPQAVARVMAAFLSAYGLAQAPPRPPRRETAPDPAAPEDLICEEALLEAFAK